MADHPYVVRLGRRYVPDDRDWTLEKLHAKLATNFNDADVDRTVRDVSASFRSWRDAIAWLSGLWAWLKHHGKPTPPAGDTTPAWVDAVVLDQGDFGTCVGNGWAGWGISTPIVDAYDEDDARAIYYEATVIDGTPDDPDAPGGGQVGSTVRSGAKAMQNRKRLVAYAFASGLADIDEWIDAHGPVVIGSDWTNDMFEPDSSGYVRPTGGVAGGHCYLLLDKLDAEDAYLFRNSWGPGWGDKGNFRMKRSDFAQLLAAQGEACCAAEVV